MTFVSSDRGVLSSSLAAWPEMSGILGVSERFLDFAVIEKDTLFFLLSVGILLHSCSTLTRSVMVSQATKTSGFLLLTFRGSWVKMASKLWSRPCDSHLCDIWHSTIALWPGLRLYWNRDLSIAPVIGVSNLSISKAIDKSTPATVHTERPKGRRCASW